MSSLGMFWLSLMASFILIMNTIQYAIDYYKGETPNLFGQLFLMIVTATFWTEFILTLNIE